MKLIYFNQSCSKVIYSKDLVLLKLNFMKILGKKFENLQKLQKIKHTKQAQMESLILLKLER
jgi:hypothetical protein